MHSVAFLPKFVYLPSRKRNQQHAQKVNDPAHILTRGAGYNL